MISKMLAVFSLVCLGLATAAPKTSARPDDIVCKNVTFWDCQSGSTGGLPTCDHETVCKNVNGKAVCRDLPSADKCVDDSGKVCTKKDGETCEVIKTLDPLDLPDPVSNDDDDNVGCTIGEEVVCGEPDKNTSKLPEVN